MLHAFSVILAAALVTGGVYLAASPKSLSMDLSHVKLSEIPAVSDEFRVVQAIPQGDLETIQNAGEITVVFSDPVVPLEALAEESLIKAPMRITAAGLGEIKGRYRWYGSRAAAFIPESALPPDTEVTVNVPAGTESLNGKKLKEDYNFSFRTPAVYVTNLSPENYNSIPYDQQFSLSFNYAVTESDVQSYIGLKVNGKDAPFTLRKGKEPWEQDTWYLTPESRFPRDANVAIFIKKGKGIREGWGSNAAFVRERSYRTYGPLRIRIEGEARFFQDLWNRALVFSSPVSVSEIIKYTEITPAAKYNGFETDNVTGLSLNSFSLSPGGTYRFRIRKGLSDLYGNTLQEDLSWEEKVPSLRREFHREKFFGIIEAADLKPVPLRVRGISLMQVSLGSFSLKDLINFNASNDYQAGISSSPEKLLEWKTGLTENSEGLIGFLLKDHTPQEYSWNALSFIAPVHDEKGNLNAKSESTYVVTTDMGITGRYGMEKLHAYVHSFGTGKSLADVHVEFYNSKQKIGSCRTDISGYCSVSHKGISDPSRILVYAENKNGDRSFAAGRLHNMYMWSVSPNFDTSGRTAFSGQIVFDRKLYRPGDTVQYKALLAMRNKGKLGIPSGNLHVRITDSNSREIQNVRLSPSSEGGIWGEVKIADGAPLGHYTMTVFTDDKKYSVSDTFQVEEFRPVSFTVDATGFTDSEVNKDLKVNISGRYLFGAPMAQASVNYTVNRKPLNLFFSNYKDYFFGDEDYSDRWEPPAFSEWTSGEGKLNDKGEFQFAKKLTAYPPENPAGENISRAYELELEASVADADQKRVTHRRYMKVYPGSALPGIAVQDRYQNYLKNFNFSFAAVNQSGQPVRDSRSMTVIVSRKDWKTIESRGPGGSLQRENTLIVTEVHRDKVTVGSEPVAYSFKAANPGIYTLLLKDDATGAYSRVEIFASGGGFIGWDFPNDDTVSVLPDKKSYKPGETAKILIRSPFENCKAIISVEREDIIWQKTFDITGNGEPVSVPITEAYLPNVYVTVLLIKPRTPSDASAGDTDPGRPAFKMGVAQLDVDHESKRLTLKVQTNKKVYLPSEEVTLTVRSEPGAEIALSVADRAVLDLVDYRYADPLKIFYSSWPHATGILDNRQSVIQRLSYAVKGQEPGGKGLESMMMPGRGGFADESEDGIRKDFRYTAYWNAAVKADAEGLAVVKFRLPHNLTTFRVQALAAKQGRYASDYTEFSVSIPVVLQPSLPLLVRRADAYTAGAVITNQTGRSGEFTVKISSPDLEIKGKDTIRILLKNGESKEAAFAFRMKDTLASGEVRGELMVAPSNPDTFRNTGFGEKNLSDRVRFTIPVKEHPPAEAFTVAGFTDSSAEEKVRLPSEENVLPGTGSLDIALSATALTGIDGAVQFYASNPYYCLEQRASAYLVSLAASSLLSPEELRRRTISGFNLAETERLFIKELKRFQNPDGGFRLWDHSEQVSDPYLTAYIAYVILRVQEIHRLTGRGTHPGAQVFSEAVKYLKNFINSPDTSAQAYSLETLSLAAYVFAKDGSGDRNLESALYKKREFMSLRAKANLMMAMAATGKIKDYKENPEIRTLMNEVNASMEINTQRVSFRDTPGASVYRSFYSRGSVLGTIIAAYTELNAADPLLPLMVRHAATPSPGLWGDSHSAGILASALLQYRQIYEKPGETGRWTVAIGNRVPQWNAEFVKKDYTVLRKSYPLPELQKVYKSDELVNLRFSRSSGRTPLYYTASLRYSPSAKNLKPRDEGIEVHREILTFSGKPHKGNFSRGEMYRVKITVISPKPVHHFLLTDPVPSGFEAVNTSFMTESPSAVRVRLSGMEEPDPAEIMIPYRTELRAGLTVITQDYLDPGIHSYEYLIRPLVRGTFYYAAAAASGMYEPEVFGRSEGYSVTAE